MDDARKPVTRYSLTVSTEVVPVSVLRRRPTPLAVPGEPPVTRYSATVASPVAVDTRRPVAESFDESGLGWLAHLGAPHVPRRWWIAAVCLALTLNAVALAVSTT